MDLGEFDLTPQRRPLKRWETVAVYLGLLDPDEPDGLSREELAVMCAVLGICYGFLGLFLLVHYLTR